MFNSSISSVKHRFNEEILTLNLSSSDAKQTLILFGPYVCICEVGRFAKERSLCICLYWADRKRYWCTYLQTFFTLQLIIWEKVQNFFHYIDNFEFFVNGAIASNFHYHAFDAWKVADGASDVLQIDKYFIWQRFSLAKAFNMINDFSHLNFHNVYSSAG